MKKKLDFIQLLLSIVAGVGWMFAGNAIYELLKGRLWLPLVIGIYFFGLSVTLLLVLFLCNAVERLGRWRSDEFRDAIVAALIVFVAATLFQLLYQIDITKTRSESTSYIFLIDESGSMGFNDPNNDRAKAISRIMSLQGGDFPFAVYSFDDECQVVIPMTSAKNAPVYTPGYVFGGGTDIVGALSTVVDDISSGSIQGGAYPRIVLLSDGDCVKTGIRDVLKKANNLGINICTVSFGQANEELMKAIAEGTYGINVRAENIDSLQQAMVVASTASLSEKRDLLSTRPPMRAEGLFIAMRIVFLLVLGALFFWIKASLMRSRDRDASVLLPHVVLITIGSLCIEVGMNILFFNQLAMRAVMCICFTCIINTLPERNAFSKDSGNQPGGMDGTPFYIDNMGKTDKNNGKTDGNNDDFNF